MFFKKRPEGLWNASALGKRSGNRLRGGGGDHAWSEGVGAPSKNGGNPGV